MEGSDLDLEAIERAIESGEDDDLDERDLVSIEMSLGNARALYEYAKKQPFIEWRASGNGKSCLACFICPCLVGCTWNAGSPTCNTQRKKADSTLDSIG